MTGINFGMNFEIFTVIVILVSDVILPDVNVMYDLQLEKKIYKIEYLIDANLHNPLLRTDVLARSC